jgi:hypothetical protein
MHASVQMTACAPACSCERARTCMHGHRSHFSPEDADRATWHVRRCTSSIDRSIDGGRACACTLSEVDTRTVSPLHAETSSRVHVLCAVRGPGRAIVERSWSLLYCLQFSIYAAVAVQSYIVLHMHDQLDWKMQQLRKVNRRRWPKPNNSSAFKCFFL